MSRLHTYLNSNQRNLNITTTRDEKPKMSLKRRSIAKSNDKSVIIEEITPSSGQKYSKLLKAFESEELKRDHPNKNTELSDEKRHSPLQIHDIINYKTQDELKVSTNKELDIFNSLHDRSQTFEEIASNDMKHLFQQAKHEILDNFPNDSKAPNKIGTEAKFNLNINEADIKQMTQNLTEEFNKISKIFEDPNSLKPNEDPYGIKRGICEYCLEGCRGYNQSTNCQDTMASICSSCHCGASAHRQTNFDDRSFNNLITSIKKDILPHVSQINDDAIMFNSFLAVFSLTNKDKGGNVLNCDCIQFLINLLREAGFKVIATEIKDFSRDESKLNDLIYKNERNSKGVEFKEYLGQFYDLNDGNNIINDNRGNKSAFSSAIPKLNQKKTDFNNLFLKNYNDDHNMIKNSGFKETTFEKLGRWNNNNNNLRAINYHNQSYNLSSSNFYLKLRKDEAANNYNQINVMNINLSSSAKRIPYLDMIRNPLLCICLSMNSSNLSIGSSASNKENSNLKSITVTNHFEKFYYLITHNPNFQKFLENSLQLVYNSKNKLNALWDIQTVFPILFKINSNIVVISDKPNLFSTNLLTNTNYFNEINETREVNQTIQAKEEKHENIDIGNKYNRDNIFGSFTSFTQSQDKFNENGINSANKGKNLLHTFHIDNENKFYNLQSPCNKFYKYFSQFKDFLIFNAISCTSTSFFDNFQSLVNFSKENLIHVNESDSIYLNNFMNYIYHSITYDRYSSNERKISISLLKKINAFNNYNHLGFFNNLDMINIKGKKEQEILSNLFLKEDSTKYSRILLIFRPLAVKSGLSECLLNIFKINECYVLKKKSIILNSNQIEFLYNSEFSSETNKTNLISFEDYSKIMSDFNAEIVVLSKFGILEDTKLICGNSNEYTDNTNVYLQNYLTPVISHLGNLEVELEVENDLIHKDDKIKSKKYHEKINFDLGNRNSNYGVNLDSFFSINSLLNLNSVFNSIVEKKQAEKIPYTYEKLNSLQKNLIKFSNQFNLFTYNTKSLNSDSSFSYSQQEINFFFPEFGSIQEVILLLKPSSEAINLAIKQTFLKMDFEVLDAVKHRMNNEEFGNLFDKYFTSMTISPYDYSRAKEIFTSGVETEVLRMVKPGGRIELNKLLGKENLNILLRSKSDEEQYNDSKLNMCTNTEKIQIIKDYCYILNISNEIEYFYHIVNSRVSIIEGQYLLQHAEYIEEEKVADLNNAYTNADRLSKDASIDIPSVSFLKNLSQQTNLMQTQNQALILDKDSILMIHVLNSCLKCTVGDSMRYDLVNDSLKEKLMDRFLKFYHYDCKSFGNENSREVVDFNMFTKWKRGKSEFNEKYFEVLHFNDDSLSSQISFFVESNAMGFFEVRIPILENALFEHNEIEIAINYLYCDPSFYQELEEKFQSENSNKIGCITMETIPFFEMNKDIELINNFVEDSNRNTNIDYVKNKSNKKENISQQNLTKLNEEWINNNLFNLKTSIENQGDINTNRRLDKNDPNELIYNKIRDNILIIKKRIFYKTKYELCKFFYKSCSAICRIIRENSVTGNIYPNITPSNHHYRIKPDDITSDIRRIYQVEEFAGLHFVEIVAQDFTKYRQREGADKALDNLNEYLTYTKPSEQSSLPVFLWGRKLAEVCKILQTKITTMIGNDSYEDITNAGPIIYSIKEQKLKGVINPKYMVEYCQYLYINILEDLQSAQGDRGLLDYKIFNENQFKIVEDKLHKILTSRVFKHSRSVDNLTISPVRVGENNLRINKIIEYPFKNQEGKLNEDKDVEHQSDKNFKQIEENIQNGEITNKTIKLIDIFCHKSSKYHAYAAILYLIKITFKKLNRKSFLLQDNELEYDSMMDALLTGFDSNIDYDQPETNDEECYNAFKSEYFLYCLSEIKFMLNEITVCKAKLGLLQQDIRSMRLNSQTLGNNHIENKYNTQKDNNIAVNYEIEIKNLNTNISSMKNNINELSMNIEIVFSELVVFDINHRIIHKEDKKIIYLPKERYHIPMYFPEYLERDVENPRYKDVKNVKESYLMDLHKVNYLNRNRNILGKTNRIVSIIEILIII